MARLSSIERMLSALVLSLLIDTKRAPSAESDAFGHLSSGD
ncbi:MAG: hypothetical protein AAFR60_05105 [Pseudomonadota bacterium]